MQLHLCPISQQCQERQLFLTGNSFAKPQTQAENKCCVCSLSGSFGPPMEALMTLFHVSYLCLFFLLLQNSHNVFSSTFLMPAAAWQENSLFTLDLPLCSPCLIFRSRISSASLIPSQSNPLTLNPWVTEIDFSFIFFFFNCNFLFEFSFSLN